MSLATQIRRSLVSVLALAAFGVVAGTQGEHAGAVLPALDAVVSCPATVEAVVEPVAAPAASGVHVDWRSRLPATIARSRS